MTSSAAVSPLRSSGGDVGRVDAQHVWEIRYTDPEGFEAVRHTLAPGPQRDLVDAFAAWRRHDFETALALTTPYLDAGLAPRWELRARGVHAAVLSELGLVDDAARCLLAGADAATTLDDPVTSASRLHDLGVVYVDSDPERARAALLDSVRLTQPLVDEPGRTGSEASNIVAIALFNLHVLAVDRGVPGPGPGLGLDLAERLAERAWPELGVGIRAWQVVQAVHAGDVAEATHLAHTLPDPSTMRDQSNAVYVIQAHAALAAACGQHDDAIALLDEALTQVPDGYALDILTDLARAYEEAGRLAEALHVVRLRADLLQCSLSDRSRQAVRGLEVVERTRVAQQEASAARRQALVLRTQLTGVAGERAVLAEQVDKDPLTGLWSRRHLTEVLGSLTAPTAGVHEVAVVDIDGFKQLNDGYGHVVGDAALCLLARHLEDATRPGDLCARYGGDEFVVLRPNSDGALATDLAEVAVVPAHPDLGVPPVRTSIGVARSDEGDAGAAFASADERMYLAKQLGGALVIDGTIPR